MGRYTRAEHERCIVAARGNVLNEIADHGVRSVFEAEVGEHSEKPDAFYALVEQLIGGPYAELFARRQRAGWLCYGDEMPEAAPCL
jgi:N6-adenosine-specific RNA methylase IME4